MADYNTFIVIDCKSRKIVLTTSSARKATKLLNTGKRIDIWSNNNFVTKVHSKNKHKMTDYVRREKDYIRQKQKRAEMRNKARKKRG